MTPAPLTREDIAMYGFHAKQQANPNLSRDPSPSESELAKVRAAYKRSREQAQIEWDRYEAEANSDPYFNGQGPRW